MEFFDTLITLFDYVSNSKRKRHIAGGVLISVSLLFGGLALTVITTRKEDRQ